MEYKTITRDQYAKQYVPLGAWVVVQKHKLPEKIGGLYTPKKATESQLKIAMSGVVVAKSPCKEFENLWEYYLMGKIQVGDAVCFACTTPIFSPAPPYIGFDGDDSLGLDLVTLHVSDILGLWTEKEDDALAIILDRFTPTHAVDPSHV